uniref:GDNF/GAS1 domain-containing protein n=1 Tax=Nothobranchius furzeri TaxID=105023 RepID=A0A8C6LES9_NOTFU
MFIPWHFIYPCSCLTGAPPMVLSAGGRDCLRSGDTCSSDDSCSPRLRTLRQCVAGDGSMKLGPGARNQCENAMIALLSTPLHGCQCKRGMKREKNCLSIYWSLHQSVLHGETGSSTSRMVNRLSLVESYPCEPEERGSVSWMGVTGTALARFKLYLTY